MMFFLVLILVFIQITLSYKNKPGYNYQIPKWAEKAFNDNKLSKTQLEKLKTRIKQKKQKITVVRNPYSSEFINNYNALLACSLPLGLIQNTSFN